MSTKKTKKKKVIDGFTKNPKNPSSKKPVEGPKKVNQEKPAEAPVEEPVEVSSEDTTVTIIEADNIEESEETPKEGTNNDIVEEPAIEDDAPTETPETDIETDTKTEPEKTEEVEVVKIEVESAPEEEAPEDEAPVSGEELVANAIVDDTAIDQNLDELINDIEKDEKKEENKTGKKEKDSKKEGSKPLKNKEDSEKKVKKEQKEKRAKKAPKKAKPFRWLSRLLALASTGAVIALAIRVITTGVIPNKYLIPALAIASVFSLFYLFKAFRNKTHISILIFLNILGVIITGASIFGFIKVQETMSFLDNNFNDNKEYSVYNIIVNKKSNYNSLDDVKGKTFHSISNFVDTERLETAASEQANAEVSYEDGIISLLNNAINDDSYIAVLNAGTWDATISLEDGKNNYNQNLKVIGELKVEVVKENITNNSDLTTDSFIIYLSGIDTRSGVMLDRSLSDVNIVVTVNPKTKRILMTTIPRDYYVQLHGTTGLPDKLTHAGSLGGLQLSMATIEDLLDFKFDRYIRVNFNFVINLVNAIGGITVDSDVNYNITAWTDRNCTYHPGANQVDGKCALAFARERYAYSDGDRHRGRNQEQVIEKIFNKLTSSSTLISRYSDILNSLSGSFDTSISTTDITSLANMQLSDMVAWTVETYNLDGTTGMTYTYSYPSQRLSVMYPDPTTVETAKAKIKEVLAGTVEAAPTETTETTIQE
ncbi:LCP family protein [Candidatus Saccharibacteria bacterium]|nr:LCP family protein [Candidatus Saccharibacteria bacterium]